MRLRGSIGRPRRARLWGAVAIAALTVALGATLVWAATPSPVWSAASEISLPTGATTAAGHQRATIRAISCPGAGSCEAVGWYTDGNGSSDYQAMIATEASGTWAPAIATGLPAGASTAPSNQDAVLESISCANAGNCAAVGHYVDSNGVAEQQAQTVTQIGGAWGPAAKLTLPAGASNFPAGNQNADLRDVTCVGVGACVAVGQYTDTNGTNDFQAMAASETNGAWGPATKITLPSGANTTAGQQKAGLDAVVCTSVGNCLAVGSYTGTVGSGDSSAMVATETSGAWGPATKLTLPSNTSAIPLAHLVSVACTSAGNCVAVGDYEDTNSNGQSMIASETNGTWAPATELSLPPGANTATSGQSAHLNAVTCASSGNCAAAGDYDDTNGTFDEQAMIATEAAGVWSPANEAVLPAGATTAAGNQRATLATMACPSAGNCVASGSYSPSTVGTSQAMVVAESGGSWGAASAIALPAGANPAPGSEFASLGALACTSPATCVAGGQYTDANGLNDYQAMVVSALPSLAVSTSSLPPLLIGVPYSAQLAATGGSGHVTWALYGGYNGPLPAGLHFDGSSGSITGTLKTVEPAFLTATATDPGPPAQQASTGLYLVVVGRAVLAAGKVTVKVACGAAPTVKGAVATAACSGQLVLTTLEHLSGHRITAISAAAGKHRRPTATTRTVTLASTTYHVRGAATTTLTIPLTRTGKQLHAAHRSIPATLTVTPAGGSAGTGAVTLRPASHKPRHRH